MSSTPLLSIANLLLPEVLVSYFELINHEIKGEDLHFYFTENNSIPEKLKELKCILKGSSQRLQSKIFPFEARMFTDNS